MKKTLSKKLKQKNCPKKSKNEKKKNSHLPKPPKKIWSLFVTHRQKIILSGGKLFLQVWSPPDNPIQSECAKRANS